MDRVLPGSLSVALVGKEVRDRVQAAGSEDPLGHMRRNNSHSWGAFGRGDTVWLETRLLGAIKLPCSAAYGQGCQLKAVSLGVVFLPCFTINYKWLHRLKCQFYGTNGHPATAQ